MAPAEKRTFKEKLRGMIDEAELVQAQAITQLQLQDARALSIELLTAGYPTAFCEFHRLAADDGDAAALPVDVLRSVQRQLMCVEDAVAKNDRFAEFDACSQLVCWN